MPEMKQEQLHLENCIRIIQENITRYEQEYKERHNQVTQLHKARRSGDVEVYNQLAAVASLEEQASESLRKNLFAKEKPYFGRIDYLDMEKENFSVIYIGKNGIFRDKTNVLIVDWRAPVATVYYENELGIGAYGLADEAPIPIDLKLKRTFDIENGCLKGFYDSDIAANDTLLIQYLSRNKDVVLREVISTIQQEQNAIIRETPFANLIVQGVAGSGKTTVAMHRISYLLYNFKERFTSNEYCIVGANDVLLNYITASLPELDVPNIKHMRMDTLLCKLCEKQWRPKKYTIVEPDGTAKNRSGLDFIRSLDHFLMDLKVELVPCKTLTDKQLGTILTKTSNIALIKENPGFSICKLLSLMEERTKNRLHFLMNDSGGAALEAKQKRYSDFFVKRHPKSSITEIYRVFLEKWFFSQKQSADFGISYGETPEYKHLLACQEGAYDIYDVAALALIYYRVYQMKPNAEFGLLFLDEAQDFGISIYYVLKKILPDTYFNIMGDVSQNINYETGLNEWTALEKLFLTGEKDKFLQLNKSYRNTIEISEYAGKILEHTSSNPYKITPVIRHGKPVSEENYWSDVEMAERVGEILQETKKKGHTSIALICKTQEEQAKATQLLKELVPDYKMLKILPIHLVKGLEFDVVILWNQYIPMGLTKPDTAKLLYVAVTRALHELYVLQS